MKDIQTYKVLKRFAAGDINQYEVAAILNLDTVTQLPALLQLYEIPISETVVSWQSDPEAANLSEYF